MALYSTTGKQYVGSSNLYDSEIRWSPDLVDQDNGRTYDGSSDDTVTATPIVISSGESKVVVAAQGSGVRMSLTDISISNAAAAPITVDLRDGLAGAVKWTFAVPGSGAGGSVNHSFQEPLQFSDNTAICADPSVSASGSSITVSANALRFTS